MRRGKPPHAKRAEAPKVEREQAVTEVPDAVSPVQLAMERRQMHWVDYLVPLITSISILLGVWQFNKERSEEAKLEFRRNVWTRQIEAYAKLGETVGPIVMYKHNLMDSLQLEERPAFDSLVAQFDRIRFGIMPLFQDTTVRNSMRSFSETIKNVRTGSRTYLDVALAGTQLMDTCKASSDRTWNDISHE